jgi:methyltransferase (TIGR00027 family)
MCDVILRFLWPWGAQVIGRSRYAEDLLQHAITRGLCQYVIIGSGFDSFALRRPDLESTLQVFELDHPDTQQAKRARLLTLGIELPKNLEFVGIDLEHETVADGLRRSSYQPEQRAFFSWLGTTPYLRNDATVSTLASIAEFAATGSDVVFDYLVPEAVLPPEEARAVERVKRFTARRAEPLVGEFDPNQLEEILRSTGLELIEHLSAAEQEKRYFANRRDGMRPTAASYLAHSRVASRALQQAAEADRP